MSMDNIVSWQCFDINLLSLVTGWYWLWSYWHQLCVLSLLLTVCFGLPRSHIYQESTRFLEATYCLLKSLFGLGRQLLLFVVQIEHFFNVQKGSLSWICSYNDFLVAVFNKDLQSTTHQMQQLVVFIDNWHETALPKLKGS